MNYKEITKLKEQSKVWCLYVNITTFYVSFKIEEGKFLGEIKSKEVGKGFYAVEHTDDDVNYLHAEDIHKTEEDTYKALIKILQKKTKDTGDNAVDREVNQVGASEITANGTVDVDTTFEDYLIKYGIVKK